jgi:arginase family enzyme
LRAIWNWPIRNCSRAIAESRPSSASPHSGRLDEVDIGLVGVPFDGGVTNRPGARHGPRDIRNQSSLIRKIN